MKPADWNEMSSTDKRKYAEDLHESLRGRYLIGQALALAVRQLSSVEPPVMREESNIQDMEVLSLLYQPWYDAHTAEAQAEIADVIARFRSLLT